MRLIDADAVYATIAYAFSDGHDSPDGQLLGNIIDEIPTISVDEIIRHGQWELIDKEPWDFCPGSGWQCSECGSTIFIMEDEPKGYNYCSTCGAKMDKHIDPNAPSTNDLKKIQKYIRVPVKADDVFVFEFQLATNEVDKSNECFSAECLWAMKYKFLGSRGIIESHNNCKAAPIIFDTRINTTSKVITKNDKPLVTLYAKAFLIYADETKQVINYISQCTLPQVSIALSVRKSVCNICGQSVCEHHTGETYDDKFCCQVLSGPVEIYEWAFVKQPEEKV